MHLQVREIASFAFGCIFFYIRACLMSTQSWPKHEDKQLTLSFAFERNVSHCIKSRWKSLYSLKPLVCIIVVAVAWVYNVIWIDNLVFFMNFLIKNTSPYIKSRWKLFHFIKTSLLRSTLYQSFSLDHLSWWHVIIFLSF